MPDLVAGEAACGSAAKGAEEASVAFLWSLLAMTTLWLALVCGVKVLAVVAGLLLGLLVVAVTLWSEALLGVGIVLFVAGVGGLVLGVALVEGVLVTIRTAHPAVRCDALVVWVLSVLCGRVGLVQFIQYVYGCLHVLVYLEGSLVH